MSSSSSSSSSSPESLGDKPAINDFRHLTANEIRKKKNEHEARHRDERAQQSTDVRKHRNENSQSGSLERLKRCENDVGADKYQGGKREGDRRRRKSRMSDEKRSIAGDDCRSDDSGGEKKSVQKNRERDRKECKVSESRSRERSGERCYRRDSRPYRHRDTFRKREPERYSDRRIQRRDRLRRGGYSSRRRSSEDEEKEEKASNRPVWATKAVVKKAEEINKRKLIWNKAEEKNENGSDPVSTACPRSSTAATWNSILAASSSDDQQLDKFKRLMGMKKVDQSTSDADVATDESKIEAEKKRQMELYTNLDQQYAVARSFTHLSRGQGLGFHQ